MIIGIVLFLKGGSLLFCHFVYKERRNRVDTVTVLYSEINILCMVIMIVIAIKSAVSGFGHSASEAVQSLGLVCSRRKRFRFFVELESQVSVACKRHFDVVY